MENGISYRCAETDFTKDRPCAYLCGMCPSCVFAKTLPVSTEHLWTVGHSFQRRFLMDLLSRCRSLRVLEKTQRVLEVTSWTMFSYTRSNKLASHVTDSQEKPLGFNGHEIREWFDSSPDWMKSLYLCRLFLRCDTDLLRALANLANVLLIRQKRGLLTFEGCKTNGESEEPALMVVPGSSKSFSGVSRYKDFISNLPVNLAKRILGFLDESCLRICGKVCRQWQLLSKETLGEIEFRRGFNEKITEIVKAKDNNIVSPTYANIVKVQVHSGVISNGKEGGFQMKTVQMEERNVYCGGFFTTDVLDKRDPHRLVDYRGKTLMAVGSKDGVVNLLYVSLEAKVISVLKGNVVHIRALLLCEDKDMVITGNFDAIIRCWNLKSETCVMTLSGHTGPVNCLDVCGDRLVSGAKDCAVKIWSLQKGKLCEEYNFKHSSFVQCVKINKTRVYSSCDKGLVKIWDLEKAVLLQVIDAHQSSVRCLFFNEWYLLTGGVSGVVMAWSTNSEAKDCLKTFSHPKEVKSLTLTYLRVVTGCADGKIRVFNFLTGDCLRVIVAGAKANHILSVHFHESSIVVNSIANVKQYHFGQVLWDYADSANKDKKHARTEEDLSSDKSKLPPASAPVNHVTQVASSTAKTLKRRKSLPILTGSIATCSTQEQNDLAKVAESEKATSERIKKRGPHHLPTRDLIHLKVNTIQRAQCIDEVGINTEHNTKLRDNWGPTTPSNDLQTVASKVIPTQALKISTLSPKCALQREVSTAPDRIMRPHPPLEQKTQPQSAKAHRLVNKSAKDVNKDSQDRVTKSLSDLQNFIKSTNNLKIADTYNDQLEFKLFTTTQLEDRVKTQKEIMTKKGQENKKGV